MSWLAGYLFHLLSFFVCKYLALLLAWGRKTDDSECKRRRTVLELVSWLTGLILFRCFCTSIQLFITDEIKDVNDQQR